jgi:hypothetical protein
MGTCHLAIGSPKEQSQPADVGSTALMKDVSSLDSSKIAGGDASSSSWGLDNDLNGSLGKLANHADLCGVRP